MRSGVVSVLLLVGCASPRGITPVVDAPTFEFDYSDFTEAEESGPAFVRVKITRTDAVNGVVSWSGIHREGDIMGWSTGDEGATSHHLVFSFKRANLVRVDFDTGVRIERLVVNQAHEEKVQECPILRTPMAECPGPRSRINTSRLDEVHCVPRSGREWTFHRSSGFSYPRGGLCNAHGGNEVPRWKPEELTEIQNREAAPILVQADADWLSKNPKVRSRGQESYRLLLEKHAKVDLVVRNWERIKTRSDADIED
jgi:hypothetical protein